jgi:hypothetical protein
MIQKSLCAVSPFTQDRQKRTWSPLAAGALDILLQAAVSAIAAKNRLRVCNVLGMYTIEVVRTGVSLKMLLARHIYTLKAQLQKHRPDAWRLAAGIYPCQRRLHLDHKNRRRGREQRLIEHSECSIDLLED